MDVSVSGTIDQKSYLKKFRGGFSPLSPPWIHLCVVQDASVFLSVYSIAFTSLELADCQCQCWNILDSNSNFTIFYSSFTITIVL